MTLLPLETTNITNLASPQNALQRFAEERTLPHQNSNWQSAAATEYSFSVVFSSTGVMTWFRSVQAFISNQPCITPEKWVCFLWWTQTICALPLKSIGYGLWPTRRIWDIWQQCTSLPHVHMSRVDIQRSAHEKIFRNIFAFTYPKMRQKLHFFTPK